VLAGPVRRGEPLTDVRLVGPSLLASVPGAVAVPVRLADSGAAALLRQGDRIDVLASPGSTAPGAPQPAGVARVVAANVLVLAVPGAGGLGSAGPGLEGTLVVVACAPYVARVLAATAERLSPALLPPAARTAPPSPAPAPASAPAPEAPP